MSVDTYHEIHELVKFVDTQKDIKDNEQGYYEISGKLSDILSKNTSGTFEFPRENIQN